MSCCRCVCAYVSVCFVCACFKTEPTKVVFKSGPARVGFAKLCNKTGHAKPDPQGWTRQAGPARLDPQGWTLKRNQKKELQSWTRNPGPSTLDQQGYTRNDRLTGHPHDQQGWTRKAGLQDAARPHPLSWTLKRGLARLDLQDWTCKG